MHVSLSSNYLNDKVTSCDAEIITPLSVSCDPGKSNLGITKNNETNADSGLKELNMATMVALYRTDAMLGGDSTQEDSPMYLSEW